MIWWLIFIAILLLEALWVQLFVPPLTQARYGKACRSMDAETWAGAISLHLIWVVALAQDWLTEAPWPIESRIVGIGLALAGNGLTVLAYRENPWFVPVVMMPPLIIKSGPYSYLRHPGYHGMMLAAIGYTVLLGQICAVVPALLYVGLLIRRIRIENKLLYR